MSNPPYHFDRNELIKARDAIRALPGIIRMSVVADLIDYCLLHFDGAGEHGKSYNSALDAVKACVTKKTEEHIKMRDDYLKHADYTNAAAVNSELEACQSLLYDIGRMYV